MITKGDKRARSLLINPRPRHTKAQQGLFAIEPKLNAINHLFIRGYAQMVIVKPIPDLIAHDIEVYGDKAYLMWTNTANRIIEDNEELIYLYDCLRHGIGEELARKTTAALPFDFGRAKEVGANE